MGEVSAWCRAALPMTVLAARLEAGEAIRHPSALMVSRTRLAAVLYNSRFVAGATMPNIAC